MPGMKRRRIMASTLQTKLILTVKVPTSTKKVLLLVSKAIKMEYSKEKLKKIHLP
jgi:hypothetical protein